MTSANNSRTDTAEMTEGTRGGARAYITAAQ